MRVVAKIGTSSITDDRGAINVAMVQSLCAQRLHHQHIDGSKFVSNR